MLVLTRKANQQIQIGPHVTVTILRVKGQTIRVGIEAPRNVSVLRAELAEKLVGGTVADSETVSAAKAAVQREQQRAICNPQTPAPVESPASDATLIRCRAVQTSALAAPLGARGRGRLLSVPAPLAVGS